MSCEEIKHVSVLLDEVVQALKCDQGGLFIDATFGAGGYSQGILACCEKTRVIAFDRDPHVHSAGMLMEDKYPNRFCFIQDCFGNMSRHIEEKVDGIVLDLGVSSMQIDQAERGFSFRFDGPLDMRMTPQGLSAKDVINGFSQTDIADILFKYGEERASYKIAKAIVSARQNAPIITTGQLSEIIHRVMPRPQDGSDSAMRSFQALRIFVNDELGELERALTASLSLLKPEGRLVVVSFHSLEDRIVKDFLLKHAGRKRHANKYAASEEKNVFPFKILTHKPIVPGEREKAFNPRSRSAKMRVGIRTEGIVS